MEYSTELEQTLLNGLPEQERRETIDSMRAATAKKLQRLRSQADADWAEFDEAASSSEP